MFAFVNERERPVGTDLYGRRKSETIVYGETAQVLTQKTPIEQVVGGRTAACTVKQNSSTSMQRCELVTSDWLPGANVTLTVTYANGKKQVLTGTADAKGYAQGFFNVAYLPKTVTHGLARSSVLVSAQAMLHAT